MKEMELMRLLKQSHALARRHPRGERGGEGCRSRGAGHILELLTERSGVSQQTIADALGVRAQSASEALAMLEGQGFIRREASPCDRRVTLIHLTDAGRVHAAELVQEHRAHARQYFSVLTEEEKATLAALLQKIVNGKEREG